MAYALAEVGEQSGDWSVPRDDGQLDRQTLLAMFAGQWTGQMAD